MLGKLERFRGADAYVAAVRARVAAGWAAALRVEHEAAEARRLGSQQARAQASRKQACGEAADQIAEAVQVRAARVAEAAEAAEVAEAAEALAAGAADAAWGEVAEAGDEDAVVGGLARLELDPPDAWEEEQAAAGSAPAEEPEPPAGAVAEPEAALEAEVVTEAEVATETELLAAAVAAAVGASPGDVDGAMVALTTAAEARLLPPHELPALVLESLGAGVAKQVASTLPC